MSPEEAAASARAQHGLDENSPIPDLVGVLESAGTNVYVVDFQNDGIDGACLSDQGRWFIFCNGKHHLVKRRFTLAHEFGHFALGHGDRIDNVISMEPSDAEEIEANQFAAAFLVPECGLDEWAKQDADPFSFEGLVRAAGFFGVSAPMTCFRFANLGKIDLPTKLSFMSRIANHEHSRVKWAERIAFHGEETDQAGQVPRVPATVQDAVEKLVERKTIDHQMAAELLRAPREEVRSVPSDSDEEIEPDEL